MSDFRPDTSGAVVNTFQAHLFSCTLGREGCCKQITLACACSISATLGLSPLTAHTAQALGCSAGNCLRPALALPRSKPLRFRYSGSPQRCRLGWACVLCLSSSGDQVFGECGHCDLSPPHPCRLVFWVYNQRTFSGGC